jgi:hypothetical protein
MPRTIEIVFTKDKDTKNTVRFTSAQGGEVSGGIYVQKGSPLASKTNITATITVDD